MVTLYGRPGCHLCDEARDVIAGLRDGGYEIELDEVDIEADPSLLHRMLERIPVVEIGDEVVSELVPKAEAIRRRLDILRK